MLPKSTRSTAPKNASPWLVLRFNTFDGEAYGRGRVEEFLGDLKSLEGLSQALIEGSAAAAKVVFLVSPSSTTKPQTLAQAGNGAIIQGRPDDVGVIQVGKTADFKTAYEMANLGQRISDAFMVLNIRQSERTTAEEVRLTQFELEQQLGGMFSLLTVEFLKPYLDRTLMVLQTSMVNYLNSPRILYVHRLWLVLMHLVVVKIGNHSFSSSQPLHRRWVLNQSLSSSTQLNTLSVLLLHKGIDTLNLIKTQQQLQGDMQQQQQMMAQQSLVNKQDSLQVHQWLTQPKIHKLWR